MDRIQFTTHSSLRSFLIRSSLFLKQPSEDILLNTSMSMSSLHIIPVGYRDTIKIAKVTKRFQASLPVLHPSWKVLSLTPENRY